MEERNSREQAAALEQAALQLDMQAPRQLISKVLFAPNMAPRQLEKLSEAQAALAQLAGEGDADDAERA